MIIALTYLLGCAGLIYFACELFVNGVEWLGHRMRLGSTAVGTVLAAFGTALPESIVTLSAVAFGDDAAERDVGVGSAMGGPLVLSTVAYGIVGIMLMRRRGHLASESEPFLAPDHQRLGRDQLAFVTAFIFKVGLGLAVFSGKPYCAALFLAYYGLYVIRELRGQGAKLKSEAIEPLAFAPGITRPPVPLIVIQVGIAVGVTAWASAHFVDQLEILGKLWHLPGHLVALVLSPIATEMPEILNACIWVRQGKVKLALANISGSMMIQATIPSALGLAYTPWLFDVPLFAAGIVTLLAITAAYFTLRQPPLRPRRMLVGWILYGGFFAFLLVYESFRPAGP